MVTVCTNERICENPQMQQMVLLKKERVTVSCAINAKRHIYQRKSNWCKLLTVTSERVGRGGEFEPRTRIHGIVNTYYFT